MTRWAALLVLLVAAAAWSQTTVPSWPARGPTVKAGIGPAAAWSRVLGSGGGATTTTSTTSTTTTTVVFAADWTAATNMLASWNFDQATSGPWTSAVSNATRVMNDASASTFHVAQDTTNFKQGTASIFFADATHYEIATTSGSGADALWNPTLTVGLSWGCWARETHGDSSGTATNLFGAMNIGGAGAGGGWGIQEVDLSPRWRVFSSWNGGSIFADPAAADGTTRGAFAHVVGTYANAGAGSDSLICYVNGAVTNTQTGSAGVRILTAQNTYATGGTIENLASARSMIGNLDECFVYQGTLTAADVCRICSCGLDGKQCTCNGTAYLSSGRNASGCNTCSLTGVTCSQANPN